MFKKLLKTAGGANVEKLQYNVISG